MTDPADVQLCAPIVANVWQLRVSAGDFVLPGTVVAVLESMKMEIPVEAASAGVIVEVPVAEGQIVQEGDPVVIVRTDPAS